MGSAAGPKEMNVDFGKLSPNSFDNSKLILGVRRRSMPPRQESTERFWKNCSSKTYWWHSLQHYTNRHVSLDVVCNVGGIAFRAPDVVPPLPLLFCNILDFGACPTSISLNQPWILEGNDSLFFIILHVFVLFLYSLLINRISADRTNQSQILVLQVHPSLCFSL